MSMGSRPSRRGQDRVETFINEASAQEMVNLHCFIPSDTHRRLKMLAAKNGTTLTNLVVSAVEDLLAAEDG